MSEVATVGSTYRFKLIASKDGAIWPLTAAVVKLYLKNPRGTTVEKTATVTDASAGIAIYTTLTTDLDVAGQWRKTWQVTDGAIVLRSEAILQPVENSP